MLSLNSIDRNELQKIVSHLDQALYNHKQWYNVFVRTLVCRLQGDNNDTLPDAHTRCRFGQWYYGDAPKIIQEHPGFLSIGDAHKRLHQSATILLHEIAAKSNVSPLNYDNFANSLEQMQLELYTLKHELEHLLESRDALTGATNRISMFPSLREQQELVKRQGENCCIAMLDLDLFKTVNDTYGHSVGDIVLTSVARYLIESIRPYDKIFRYGGEEFLLCLPFTELDEGVEIIERLRKEIAKMTINILNQSVKITASIGIALLDPDLAAEKSVDRADQALYEAKHCGKNCVKVWDGKSIRPT